MKSESNVTARAGVTQRARAAVPALPPGLVLGALGVLAFSFSLPATRLAVADLDPWLVAFGRAVVAGLLAAAVLAATRAPRPTPAQWRALTLVALGVVVGFPLFTSLALHRLPASHGAVFVGMLPAATAVAAVLRAGERPTRRFWAASGAGLLAVLAFALSRGGGELGTADLELLIAVLLCALGYAEGGRLSRDLGGARTICWALVLSLPVTIPVAATAVATQGAHAAATAWLGFAYVSVISMFLGFFAWYAGLARGGVAKIGQVQLAQPVLGLVWAALILDESVGPGTIAAAVAVLACVVATQRTRVASAAGAPRASRDE
ncbi:MAG TPA: DMT family transporter [Baekduia sp.]|uniref:DMT family transporter n=1 Tax=Baekduia sp. TaxID=2600305 RepID=UPI002D120D34|nr:DMT family transporter [Baekduia sp.]HMJ35805.1 DMT family transporter [Baekduia sp.]